MIARFITDWVGKSPALDGGVAHPAAYHMLDVAAVAELLIQPFDFDPALKDALLLLVALHDIGKVNDAFQRMLTDGIAQTHGRHWEVTEVYLIKFNPLATLRSSQSAMLYAAAAGHHGKPPNRDLKRDVERMLLAAGERGLMDASELTQAFQTLWPDAVRVELSKYQARDLSWWLPAHAGMNRPTLHNLQLLAAVPRTRGDEPFCLGPWLIGAVCSPHTRG